MHPTARWRWQQYHCHWAAALEPWVAGAAGSRNLQVGVGDTNDIGSGIQHVTKLRHHRSRSGGRSGSRGGRRASAGAVVLLQ